MQSQLQNKDGGSDGVKKNTHSLHVESRRFHKARAEVVNDEGRGTKGDAVLTQGAYYQHLLEVVTVIVPVSYKIRGKKQGGRDKSW